MVRLSIRYTNWRGVTEWRAVEIWRVERLAQGTPFHPRRRWFLAAVDLAKSTPKQTAVRRFAIRDISAIKIV